MYFAIEIHGIKKNRFTIREVFENGTNPVPGTKIYKSETEAREDAEKLNIKIEKIGSFYEILPRSTNY